MKNKKYMKLAMLTIPTVCLVTLGSGCVERRVEYVPVPSQQVISSPADASVVTEAPPPPQVEVVPVAPGPEYVWTPGYWTVGVGGRWVWVGGRYAARPHPHAAWVAGHWARHGHGYVWVGGHWR